MDQSRARIFGLLLLVLFVIPTIGIVTAIWCGLDNEAQFRETMQTRYFLDSEQYEARFVSYETYCRDLASKGELEQRAANCSNADSVHRLALASVAAAACGAALLALIFGGRALAGSNRARMALLFGPLVQMVLGVLALVIAVQCGLIIYLVYAAESVFLQRASLFSLGAVALGALVAGFQLIEHALSYRRTPPFGIRGLMLDRSQDARLHALVDDIARRLGTHAPDQIVAGLEPVFFVTVDDLRVTNRKEICRGRTLFVSLTLMRLLDESEFRAIMGHELGHFRGQDLEYSLKFAPIYARLRDSLRSMLIGQDKIGDIARLPAFVALCALLQEFTWAERTVRRERELVADQAGVESANAHSRATSLVKQALFGGFWESTLYAYGDALSEDRHLPNLSVLYVAQCEGFLQTIDLNEAREFLASRVQAHPVDTHPPLGQRLEALGMSLDAVSNDDIRVAPDPASALLAAASALEEELTLVEKEFLTQMRAAAPGQAAPVQPEAPVVSPAEKASQASPQ